MFWASLLRSFGLFVAFVASRCIAAVIGLLVLAWVGYNAFLLWRQDKKQS